MLAVLAHFSRTKLAHTYTHSQTHLQNNTMLANTFRQLSRGAANKTLVNQGLAASFNGLAPFASAAAQPSDPKTVLAILYKASDAAQEKRLLGRHVTHRRTAVHFAFACIAK